MNPKSEHQILRLFATLLILSLMFVWGLRAVLFAPSQKNIQQFEQKAELQK